MLTKEEYEKALSKLWDNTFGTDCITGEDLDKYVDIIDVLIQYVFNPQPYKLEDLKPNMWVWDDVNKDCRQIARVNEYGGIYWYGSLSEYESDKFEENRFFPLTKALEYQ